MRINKKVQKMVEKKKDEFEKRKMLRSLCFGNKDLVDEIEVYNILRD